MFDHFGIIEEDRVLYYIESRAKEGLQQHQTENFLNDTQRIKEKWEENKHLFKHNTVSKAENWDVIMNTNTEQNTGE